MAVVTSTYAKTEPIYKGCVIDKFERNGYDDSDFYAACWDEEKQSIVYIEYDTTRCGDGGYANIDASEDVLRKVFRYLCRAAREQFDTKDNPKQAKEVKTGDDVVVVRGTKVGKGTVGKVFWQGICYNKYSYRDEERVGIEVNGERVFLPLGYVEVIGWEKRLIKGKERREKIRSAAVREMPYHYRDDFSHCYFQGKYRW